MSFNFGSGSINTGNTNGNNWGHPQVLDDELRFLVQQQRQHQHQHQQILSEIQLVVVVVVVDLVI